MVVPHTFRILSTEFGQQKDVALYHTSHERSLRKTSVSGSRRNKCTRVNFLKLKLLRQEFTAIYRATRDMHIASVGQAADQ